MDKDAFKDYPRRRVSLQPVRQDHATGSGSAYLNMFLSSSMAEVFLFPLNVTKAPLQLHSAAGNEAGATVASLGSPVRELLRPEVYRGLLIAMPVIVLRNLLFNSPRVHIYDKMRRNFLKMDSPDGGPTVLRRLMSAGMAGATAQVLVSPLENIQHRMYLDGKRGILGHPVRAFDFIYAQSGLKGFWNGVGPGSLHAMLLTAGDTACYDLGKRLFMLCLGTDDGRLVQFLASVVSGLSASVLSTPADKVKTLLLSQPRDNKGHGMLYANTMDCCYKLITKEGFLATYKGFLQNWLRIGPWNVLFWLSFETLQRMQGKRGF
ncbi:hypothetical protein KR222_009272 [Zaprionus bogoriensis]|nr:hypothetical protein KR222_009272 [Zaprionus bogoriensis]